MKILDKNCHLIILALVILAIIFATSCSNTKNPAKDEIQNLDPETFNNESKIEEPKISTDIPTIEEIIYTLGSNEFEENIRRNF